MGCEDCRWYSSSRFAYPLTAELQPDFHLYYMSYSKQADSKYVITCLTDIPDFYSPVFVQN